MQTRFTMITLALTVGVPFAVAQSFSSGSTGADGALNLTTPGTIIFNPKSFNPPLNPAGDNIFNFTTINIAAGVTLKLSGQVLNGPVYWLAQGSVTIDGTIDLNGGDGIGCGVGPSGQIPSTPGAGGYPGGLGGLPGDGPGGGAVSNGSSGGNPGIFTGNRFLVPLVGGSGGGGGVSPGSAGGGAGGGAILIASSTSIGVNGTITASGGRGSSVNCNSSVLYFSSGAGSGGAIRVAAPLVSGTGVLAASSGQPDNSSLFNPQSNGVVRIEAFQNNFTGSQSGSYFAATPFGVFVPSAVPSLAVVSVAGTAVTPSPTGSFIMPDVSINQSGPVLLALQARNIPLGTVVTLQIFSENGPNLSATSTPLTGNNPSSSTATATVTLPPGYSRGFVKATWTQ